LEALEIIYRSGCICPASYLVRRSDNK